MESAPRFGRRRDVRPAMAENCAEVGSPGTIERFRPWQSRLLTLGLQH